MKTSNSYRCLGLFRGVVLAWSFGFAPVPAKAAVIATVHSDKGGFELLCETAPYSASTPTAVAEFGPPSDMGVVLNQMTRLLVTLTDVGGAEKLPLADASLDLDAQMPVYELGMVVRPAVTQLAPGRFLIEGVKLHMAGEWELRFTVTRSGKVERLVVPVLL